MELRQDGQLTREAPLLFGRKPLCFLRQSEARVAPFWGRGPLHFLDLKVIEGTLIEQRRDILEFIQRHVYMAAEIKGLEREER